MNDETYGQWFAYRMCNGHGGDAGKWTVGYQEKARAPIVRARTQGGTPVVFSNKNRAETRADQMNANGEKPKPTKADESDDRQD